MQDSHHTFRPILLLVGPLGWEKTDLIRGLKHLAAMLSLYKKKCNELGLGLKFPVVNCLNTSVSKHYLFKKQNYSENNACWRNINFFGIGSK